MGFWNLKDCECTEVIRSDQKPNGGRGDPKRGAQSFEVAAATHGTAQAMQLKPNPEERLANASSGRCLRPEGLQLH